MLWSETEPNLPNTYSSASGQVYSLEQRFQKDLNLKGLYQHSKDKNLEKRFVKILDQYKKKGRFAMEWYLPHHPELNKSNPFKVRRVCNAASKYNEVCLNDNLPAGTDLLHGLIGTIFRMSCHWTHGGQINRKCLSFCLRKRCERGWEYSNLVGNRNLYFQNQRRQSVIEGYTGVKDNREYEEVHRRAVRSGNAMEWTRAKSTENLQLSLRSSLLTGAKISIGRKLEKFVSTFKRQKFGKKVRKDIGPV